MAAARGNDEPELTDWSPAESIAPNTDSDSSSPPAEKTHQADKHVDGGTKAWLQVLGAFFIYFNTWGECAEEVDRGLAVGVRPAISINADRGGHVVLDM